MTGGIVVVLGPVGANFGAGMTGGRAYLHDPEGRHVAALHGQSVGARRLAAAGPDRLEELTRLLVDHRDAGSAQAARLLAEDDFADSFWLVEPVAPPVAALQPGLETVPPLPTRNRPVPVPPTTADRAAPTLQQ
jgi:glutamate synthase domain-containing protein 3